MESLVEHEDRSILRALVCPLEKVGPQEYRRLRRVFRRHFGGNHRHLKARGRRRFAKMVASLDLRVGDVIQTCADDFNHVIGQIDASYPFYDPTLVTENGRHCSWLSCCGKALTPAQIEAVHRREATVVLGQSYEDSWLFQWHAGDQEGRERFERTQRWYRTILERLDAGLPICDERGVALPDLVRLEDFQ